jgi:hypothetical protein
VLGVLDTAAFAGLRGWPVVVPVWASAGGVAATVVLGVVAGIYPAVRAPGWPRPRRCPRVNGDERCPTSRAPLLRAYTGQPQNFELPWLDSSASLIQPDLPIADTYPHVHVE